MPTSDEGAARAPSPRNAMAPSPDDTYAVFVMGASGDLAHKKTYPSLFELFVKGLLPAHTVIAGYARSAQTDAVFRDTIRGKLKGGSDEQKAAFVQLCIYRNGGYDDAAAFGKVRVCTRPLSVRCGTRDGRPIHRLPPPHTTTLLE